MLSRSDWKCKPTPTGKVRKYLISYNWRTPEWGYPQPITVIKQGMSLNHNQTSDWNCQSWNSAMQRNYILKSHAECSIWSVRTYVCLCVYLCVCRAISPCKRHGNVTCTKLGNADEPRPRTTTKIRPPISAGRLSAAGELDLDSMGNRSLARLLCAVPATKWRICCNMLPLARVAATCDRAQSQAGFDSDSFVDPLGLKWTTKWWTAAAAAAGLNRLPWCRVQCGTRLENQFNCYYMVRGGGENVTGAHPDRAPTSVIWIVSTWSKYFKRLFNYSFDILIAFCAEICLLTKKSNEYLKSRICWYLLVFVGIIGISAFIASAHQ